MSAWLLVLMLSTGSVTIPMASEAACIRVVAAQKTARVRSVQAAFCVNRETGDYR
jgi:hypothetical protein